MSDGSGQHTKLIVGDDSVYGVHGELHPSGTSQFYIEEGSDSVEYDPFTSKEVRFSMNVMDTDASVYFKLACDGNSGRLYQEDPQNNWAQSTTFPDVFHLLEKKPN